MIKSTEIRMSEEPVEDVPGIGTTLGILAGLMLPFFIHMLATEPFPALILPAGAHQYDRSQDSVTVTQIVVQAKRQDSMDFEDIPPQEFLHPMPAHYLHSIARNQFGLVKNWRRRVRGRKGLIQFEHSPTGARQSANIDSAKQWYRARLAELGFASQSFRLATYERQVQMGEETSARRLVSSVTYELN